MKTETNSETSDPRTLVTAWALDELSPDERAAFLQRMENDPELATFAAETKEFCGLLALGLQQPTIELQQAARSRLLFEAERLVPDFDGRVGFPSLRGASVGGR
jgi:hypothetical protein